MTDQRVIIEMGMGNDLHGRNATKAAARAIEDALRHSTLALFRMTGIAPDAMRIVVTVGVQDPDGVDRAALAALLPYGTPEIRVVRGGLDVTDPATGETAVVASAAVEVFLPSETGNWRQTPP
jgi:uncharacterized protein (TIGR02058 family)